MKLLKRSIVSKVYNCPAVQSHVVCTNVVLEGVEDTVIEDRGRVLNIGHQNESMRRGTASLQAHDDPRSC